MDSARTDEMLMIAYGEGDADAFAELYRRWRSRLYRYLQRQVGNPAAADEIFQEVWMKIISARRTYEATAKFSTWMFRIAHNRLIDGWRASGRRALELASYDDEDDPLEERIAIAAPEHELPDRSLERRHVAERISAALAALPAAQRETFLLVEEGEMTLEEAGAAMGTSRETAKSRLRYALAKLRAALGDLL